MKKPTINAGILARKLALHTAVVGTVAALPQYALAQQAARSIPWASTTWSGGPLRNEYTIWDSGKKSGWPPCVAADFNGDGIADIICLPGDAESDQFQWSVGLSDGKGFSSTSIYSMTMTEHKSDKWPDLAQCFVMDMTGTGSNRPVCVLNTADIKNAVGNTVRGQVNVMAYFNGSYSSIGSLEQQTFSPPLHNEIQLDKCFVTDLNGDGADDIICGTVTSPYPDTGQKPYYPGIWVVYLSKNLRGSPPTFVQAYWATDNPTGSTEPMPDSQNCLAGDFNGDGTVDLACWMGGNGGTGWEFFFSPGSNTGTLTPVVKVSGPTVLDGNIGNCLVGDFNGDGISDIACYAGGSGGDWYVTTNTASSNSTLVTSTWASGVSPNSPVNNQCSVANLNNDNLADIICSASSPTSSPNENHWAFAISTGVSFGGGSLNTAFTISNKSPNTLTQACAFGDFNGDGLTDIACTKSTGNGVWDMGLTPGPYTGATLSPK